MAAVKERVSSDTITLWLSRELEVVRMIAQGKTNKEVAACLECSEHTIKTHKTNVMRKLNLSNAVEISVWALKRNLA